LSVDSTGTDALFGIAGKFTTNAVTGVDDLNLGGILDVVLSSYFFELGDKGFDAGSLAVANVKVGIGGVGPHGIPNGNQIVGKELPVIMSTGIAMEFNLDEHCFDRVDLCLPRKRVSSGREFIRILDRTFCPVLTGHEVVVGQGEFGAVDSRQRAYVHVVTVEFQHDEVEFSFHWSEIVESGAGSVGWIQVLDSSAEEVLPFHL